MIVDIADNFELTEWRGKRFWLMTADGSQAPQVDFLFRQQPVLLLHEIPTVFLAWNLLLGQSGAWQSSCCAFPKILHKLKWWMTLIVFWMIVSECTRVHYVGVGHPDRLKLCGYQLLCAIQCIEMMTLLSMAVAVFQMTMLARLSPHRWLTTCERTWWAWSSSARDRNIWL